MSRITRFSLTALLAASVLSAPAVWAQQKTASASAKSSTTASSSAYKSTETSSSHKSKSTTKVDLNVATKEELMKLPGIDEATAEKIIAARPFKSKSELVDKKLVSKSEYQKVSPHVLAKAPAKEPAGK